MKTMKSQLLASSSTISGIAKVASDYYGGLRTLSLVANEKGDEFTLENANGAIQGVRIINKAGRFRFERID